MALEKKTVISQISVDPESGLIHVRESNLILEDGIVIAETYRRAVLEPGQDVSQKEQSVKNVTEKFWTPEIVQKHQQKLAKQNEKGVK